MHDLNTINRLNAEAFERAISSFQAQGRFVLARYEGAHLVSIETFSSVNELVDAHNTAHAANPVSTGVHFKCFQPVFGVNGRDQSEDRKQPYTLEQLAAFARGVTPPAETTLGDYIARKSALLDDPAA
jgi:hypothetical protein